MSIYLYVGGEDAGQVATNTGWGEFMDWVDSLPEEYDQLHHLTNYGWDQDLDGLEKQLRSAIATGKPEKDVHDIAIEMMVAIRNRPEGAESVQVSNGMSSRSNP